MILLAIAPITVLSLLHEMSDLDRLAWPAEYTAAQASSYDRASKSPLVEWFANADAGQYLRLEERDGRKEHVMADLKGPGAVVRIWSANPAGRVRFYFDGEATPRLEAPLAELLRGKIAPFGDAYAYEASRGCNLYFPFPYAKSLKITVDESGDVRGLYYHVGYRTYGPGAAVQSFDRSQITSLPKAPERDRRGQWKSVRSTVASRRSASLALAGPAMVRELRVDLASLAKTTAAWTDPKAPHNVLRSLILTVKVDGETTVAAPLGDFFGSAPGLVPYRSQAMEVGADGSLTCNLPMPIGREMTLHVENRGSVAVPLEIAARVEKLPETPPYRLHAQWTYDRGRTRPMRDLAFLETSGQGRFVGTSLHVENPTPGWWGEGDEKVFVDGEAFPSTFGTGTEDYYGYAWCCPEPFQRPYHGQPRCDGPGNFGHTNVYRWQTFDDIPYTRSMKFDIEMWHWEDVTGTWARMAYWYAAPGGTGHHPVQVKLPVELAPPKPVEGAIEGEALEVKATGGTHEAQGGFWQLSQGKQRWWMDAQPGEKLVLTVPVREAGRYELIGNFCHARDYGIHELFLNGKRLAQIDFYSADLGWKRTSLGVVKLEAGNAILEVVCKGSHKEALPRRMFGVDYLLLVKR